MIRSSRSRSIEQYLLRKPWSTGAKDVIELSGNVESNPGVKAQIVWPAPICSAANKPIPAIHEGLNLVRTNNIDSIPCKVLSKFMSRFIGPKVSGCFSDQVADDLSVLIT